MLECIVALIPNIGETIFELNIYIIVLQLYTHILTSKPSDMSKLTNNVVLSDKKKALNTNKTVIKNTVPKIGKTKTVNKSSGTVEKIGEINSILKKKVPKMSQNDKGVVKTKTKSVTMPSVPSKLKKPLQKPSPIAKASMKTTRDDHKTTDAKSSKSKHTLKSTKTKSSVNKPQKQPPTIVTNLTDDGKPK